MTDRQCKRCGEVNPAEIHTCTPKEIDPELAFIKDWNEGKVRRVSDGEIMQPEPAECDGGQCGIGGYCKECPKPLVKLKEMLEVQGRDGTWNYDHYFHGMYNGMEVMLAVLEGREPVFREAPEKWLSKKEWVGLTDEEAKKTFEKHNCTISADLAGILARAITVKLKEKNNG